MKQILDPLTVVNLVDKLSDTDAVLLYKAMQPYEGDPEAFLIHSSEWLLQRFPTLQMAGNFASN